MFNNGIVTSVTMNQSVSPSCKPSFILSTLLADGAGKPTAVLLEWHALPPETITMMLESEAFLQLSAQLPCLVLGSDAQLDDPDLEAALLAAKCERVPDSAIASFDAPLDGKLPPSVKWVRGEWYKAPPVKASNAQAASRALALQMVQLVLADADTHEIEALFRRDPALSYHLLRLVNSLGVGVGKKIASFSQAIVILGRQQLRRWLNLMLFSARDGDQRSAMLFAKVAVRARTMELVAKSAGLDRSNQELAFMTGMFSLLGILFGQPLEDVLKPLAISETLRAGVLDHAGELGTLLSLMEAADAADTTAMNMHLATLQVAPDDYNLHLIDAHTWMLNIVRDTAGSPHA